jgi:hypothetical protein
LELAHLSWAGVSTPSDLSPFCATNFGEHVFYELRA